MRTTLATLAIVLALGCAPEPPGRVLLVPLGDVPVDVLDQLRAELPAITGREVAVAATITAPEAALDPARRQYLGSALLEELARYYKAADAERIVGVIDADTYAPGLHFIFGQAQKPGRYAVVALPRLRNTFYGRREDPALFRERAVKVAAHELGHSLGYAHCPEEACVMHFANSVLDADRQGKRYCGRER